MCLVSWIFFALMIVCVGIWTYLEYRLVMGRKITILPRPSNILRHRRLVRQRIIWRSRSEVTIEGLTFPIITQILEITQKEQGSLKKSYQIHQNDPRDDARKKGVQDFSPLMKELEKQKLVAQFEITKFMWQESENSLE